MKPSQVPRLREPGAEEIAAFLTAQAAAPFTYAEVGATRDVPGAALPGGYDHDRTFVDLGEGSAVYARACAALRAWRMFPDWARVTPRPLETWLDEHPRVRRLRSRRRSPSGRSRPRARPRSRRARRSGSDCPPRPESSA